MECFCENEGEKSAFNWTEIPLMRSHVPHDSEGGVLRTLELVSFHPPDSSTSLASNLRGKTCLEPSQNEALAGGWLTNS